VVGDRRMEPTRGALVTGANRGIGRAIAIELANRGFNTVATMRNPADAGDLIGESKGRLNVGRLDVTEPASYVLPDDLCVLVNNAGIDTDYLPVEHSDLDHWRRLFETNVLGTVGLTMAAIPLLRANQPSVVCNITSSSILASVPFYSAYRATKAAVSRLRRQPSGGGGAVRHPGGRDTAWPDRH
jgi:NAD(P)-dependent dehydrogenase (short-subunit alcohol dehydrogenase family)